ncbi:unnamed protein product, partial [Ixodes hexagonus]
GRHFLPLGQRLCTAGDSFIGGKGTYVQHGYIYSSLAGRFTIERQKDKKILVEVHRSVDKNVPAPGNIVTAKITAVTHRLCKCSIIAIEDCELWEPFRGIIRKEDVHETEKDKVEMHKSFRMGDIVLARVMSIGDALSYYLTTAENMLGVVVALSASDVPMVPVSWTAMQCPVSSVREPRKIAKLAPIP